MTRARAIGDVRPQTAAGRAVAVPVCGEGCEIGVPAWVRALLDGAATERDADGVVVRFAERASLVSVELDSARGLAPAEFELAIEGMIERAMEAVGRTAAPFPVRVWNFLPGIFDRMGPEMDRYRAFNVARYRALTSRLGARAVSQGALPTASCVGHDGERVAIHTLGSAKAGVPIENPRQVPAFEYSNRYGVRPPCFARAMRAEFDGRAMILVAGTASVVGEDSAHTGSLELQAAETVTNLSAVLGRARGTEDRSLSGVRAVRIYHAHERDRSTLEHCLPVEFVGAAEVEWVRADICRRELRVEIEVVADAG
jgi:chorismate lyase / 3-hydroxybenzoate synthase